MKLSKIVAYLNLLQKIDLNDHVDTALSKLSDINHVVSNHQVQLDNFAADLIVDFDQVNSAMLKFHQTFDSIKSQLQLVIDKRKLDLYQESSMVYQQETRLHSPEYILNRRLCIDDENNALLRGRIKIYSDWRLPGMIMRPGLETFIEEMVPLDPLYIVDHHQDLIAPSVSKFTPEYQRRLRTYVIDDYVDDQVLWRLPDAQFGFVFAYDFLNYKPIHVIERYLAELMKKLRPGGIFIFTYNECDNAHGVGLAESNFMCYTPGQHIRAIVKELGFEILFNQVGPYDISWLEIKKPGEITSLRGGQTLAQIFQK